LLGDKPIDATAKVNSIFGPDARVYPKKYGEFMFGLGIFGFAFPGTDIFAGAGAQALAFHETPHFSVGGSLRIGGASQSQENAFVLSVSMGGSYLFSEENISPYIGAGLALSSLRYSEDEGDISMKSTLFGAYLLAGIELMRLYDSRFDIGLRVDLPFNTLEGYDASNDHTRQRYIVPISLSASYCWN
jgi:hypothetical protein